MCRSRYSARIGSSADGGGEPLASVGFPCPFEDAPPPPLCPVLVVDARPTIRNEPQMVADGSPSPTTSEESRTVANCSNTSQCSSSGTNGCHATSGLRSDPPLRSSEDADGRPTSGAVGYGSNATTASDQARATSSPPQPNGSGFGSSDMGCTTAIANVYAAHDRTSSHQSVRTIMGDALLRRNSPAPSARPSKAAARSTIAAIPAVIRSAEGPLKSALSVTVGLNSAAPAWIAPATPANIDQDWARHHFGPSRFSTAAVQPSAVVSVKVGLRPDPCQEHPRVPAESEIARNLGTERSYTKLFVGQIPTFVDAKSWLAEVFAPFNVRDILVRGHSQRATAFVWCGSRDRAEAAVVALNGFKYENNGTWYALCVEPSLSSYK